MGEQLPTRRSVGLVARLDRLSWGAILLSGVFLYLLIPAVVSVVEALLVGPGLVLVRDGEKHSIDCVEQLYYFNLVSTLTIGYGDYVPVHVISRSLAAVEAILGMCLFGLLISVTSIKLVLPPKQAITFSRYGYYCRDNQRFMVVFVNTTTSVLVNPEMCSYYRQGDDFTVRPPFRAPFIRQSVWTFHLEHVPEATLRAGFAEKDRSLRFGISGSLNLGSASAYVEYGVDEILVIPSRAPLTAFQKFRNADLADPEFREMFDYRPADALTLGQFARGLANGSIKVETVPDPYSPKRPKAEG